MGAVKSNSKRKNEGKRKNIAQKSRKEKRKEKRLQKKQNRQIFNEKKYNKKGDPSAKDNKNLVDVTKLKKKKLLKNDVLKDKGAQFKKSNFHDKFKLEQELQKKEEEQFQKDVIKQRKEQLAVDVDDDKEIQKYAKLLNMNKKKKNGSKSNDVKDFDYIQKNGSLLFLTEELGILDFFDEEKKKISVDAEKLLFGENLGSDFKEDFADNAKTIKKKNKKEKPSKDETHSENLSSGSDYENDFSFSDDKCETESKLTNENDSFEDSDIENELDDTNELDDELEDELDDSDAETSEESGTDDKVSFKSKKRSSFDDDDDDDSNDSHNNKKKRKVIKHEDDFENSDFEDEEKEGEEKESSKTWEDIYGRTRDSDGNVITNRYVPPAARVKNLEKDSENSEKLLQLKRQLKGPLNRLTDRNMHTISTQIEKLYMTNSRNDMNEMLTKLMIEALVSPVMTPNRLIVEHMMLITVLHANVDSEVGAHFLLSLVKRINESMKIPVEVENKELDNLILTLSQLYNFKVFGSKLIYEILEKLAEKFTEKEIDLILLILKNVGFVLRKDNPLALKELILKLQQKASVTKCENSRVKYMLDILLAIKNNNMSKIPQYDPSIMDQMKKLLKTLIRKGNSISQLNVSLEDLLNVEERGKWWIVGAAWSGNSTQNEKEKVVETKAKYSTKLLELARKQRMNTDTRRNIFCILMSAEDFLDAFEKLHHLGLKGGQDKEIIYVLMNCCLQEKNFNPYYAVLAQKLCDYDRKYQMTIQYNLWDKLKTLDTLNNKQITNLARFLTHLFIQKGLSISTMKVIQLEELDKPKMKLVRRIMIEILMCENLETCLAVFERITRSDELKTFREALRLFINQFVVKNVKEGLIPNDKAALIKERAELVDRILTTRNSRIVF